MDAFSSGLFQWGNALCVSGKNMPFALPLQVDKTGAGFAVSFLRVVDGNVFRIAKVDCAVEQEGEVRAPAR